ncbi:AraC family transcriptional regulator [Streptoalloteichus hindustanus]|uniref:HTH-type transcriptional regulator RipA n=1 Tax=Streptoalloteichus hindustanus TaxID=2017 RepID=A0A1M5Q3C4_STRHI|nr:helix-turn-helix transcriptional regulator [Streptoalloteichus hindustanus]SHH08615.1 AraC-type DNA-binding protein [Streptoalloteichus hindustanus]
MSRSGHVTPLPPLGAIVVGTFDMSRGERFDWHEHTVHQLAWAARGVLTVSARGSTWVLPPTRALWIPARVRHTTGATSPATMRSLYFWPDECPVDWAAPTVVEVRGLLRELIGHLAGEAVPADSRAHAEALVLGLLTPLSVTTIDPPEPRDDRARRVAAALVADPADGRCLASWGRLVGASARTLARLFVAETGMSFGRWRGQARLRAALPLLAEGVPIAVVARRVGYATPSAFVAAFRKAIGVPPGAYFARDRGL